MARVAALVMAVQAVFLVYQMLPGHRAELGSAMWLLPMMFVGLAALWSSVFLWCLGSAPLTLLVDRNWLHARHLQELEREEEAREEALAHG